MVTSAEAVESKPTARPRAMPRIINAVEIFVLMGDTPLINVGSGVARLPQPGGSLLKTSWAFFIPCSALMSEVRGFLVGPLMDMDTAEIFRTAFFWLQ